MLTFNMPEAVVLHLNMYRRMQGPYLPIEVTQEGIALSLDTSRSHVSLTMTTLIRRGLVKSESARVRGKNRRVNIYELTESGIQDAERLLSVLKEVRLYHDGTMTDAFTLYRKGVPIGEIIRESSTSGWSQASKPTDAQVEMKVIVSPSQVSTVKREEPLIQPAAISELSTVPKETVIESAPAITKSRSGEMWYVPPQTGQQTSASGSSVWDWYFLGFFGCVLLLGPLYLIFIASSLLSLICIGWLFGALLGIILISMSLKNLKKIDPDAARRCTEIVVFCVVFTVLLFYQILTSSYRYSVYEMLGTLTTVTFVVSGLWLSLGGLKNVDKQIRSKSALVAGLAFAGLGAFSPYFAILSKYASISLFLFLFAAGMILLSIEIRALPTSTYVDAIKITVFVFIIVGLIYALASIRLTLGMRSSAVLWIAVFALIIATYLLQGRDQASKGRFAFLPDSRDLTKFLVSSGLLTVGLLIARSSAFIEGGVIVTLALVMAYYWVRPLKFDMKNIASFTLIIVAEAMTVSYFLIQS